MDFETSLVIHQEIRSKIAKLSEISGKSSCFLVKKMINAVIKEMKRSDCIDSLTEYQNIHNNDLVIFRYRLTKNEHDDFTYARHKFKISVSKMLLIGFLLFFNKMVKKYIKSKKKINKITNNYTIIFGSYYFFLKESIEKRGIELKNYP